MEGRPDPRRARPRHHLAQHAEPQGGDVRGEDLRLPPGEGGQVRRFPARGGAGVENPLARPGTKQGGDQLRPLVHDEVRPFEERGVGEDRGGLSEDESVRREPAGSGVFPFVGESPRQRIRDDPERVGAHREGRFLEARGEVRPRLRLPQRRRERVDQIPRGRSLRGKPAGVSLRGKDGNLPRADDPAQNRVDEPPRAAAPRRLDGRHRFVQRRAVGNAGVEELVRPHPEGVPDVRVGLFEGTGEERQKGEIDRAAPAQGSHHELRQEPPVAGIGKARVAQRAVEHDVGEGLVAVHPGQDRDRRVPYDSRSPVATRRPWAYAHASIAFPPSGCTT